MGTIISDSIILPCDGEFYAKTISLEDARSFCQGDILSGVSDPFIANVLTELLGTQIPVNQTLPKPECGQTVICFQLKSQPEKRKTLTQEEMEELGYEFKILKTVKENTPVKTNTNDALKYLLKMSQTLDYEYYFKELSEAEYEKIENDFFEEKNNGVVDTREGSRPAYNLQHEMGIISDITFSYKAAALPQAVVLLIDMKITYGRFVKFAIVIPKTAEPKGKYVKAHLKRILWSDGYGGEIAELYPVLLKADTMQKDGFIPLFDMYKEQSFERLYQFMTVHWEKPYDETVIQELYEKRNPELFLEYKIIENPWSKYLGSGQELSPNIFKMFGVFFEKYNIR